MTSAIGARTIPPRMRSTYPTMITSMAASRKMRARRLAPENERGMRESNESVERTRRASVRRARQAEKGIDATVVALHRAVGMRVGYPASVVHDEGVAMLAGAQRERHGPAARALITHERGRRCTPAIEVAGDLDALRIGRVEHESDESDRIA